MRKMHNIHNTKMTYLLLPKTNFAWHWSKMWSTSVDVAWLSVPPSYRWWWEDTLLDSITLAKYLTMLCSPHTWGCRSLSVQFTQRNNLFSLIYICCNQLITDNLQQLMKHKICGELEKYKKSGMDCKQKYKYSINLIKLQAEEPNIHCISLPTSSLHNRQLCTQLTHLSGSQRCYWEQGLESRRRVSHLPPHQGDAHLTLTTFSTTSCTPELLQLLRHLLHP